jgi:hypothetical protein
VNLAAMLILAREGIDTARELIAELKAHRLELERWTRSKTS